MPLAPWPEPGGPLRRRPGRASHGSGSVAAGQQVLAGRQDMHLEGLEQIGLVGLPLQRVGLELAAEGHLRVLLVLPDRRWRPLGHGQGIAQGLVRHHVGHQYHGHVPLQRLVHQVQHLRVARIVHAAIGARIEFRHATGKAKQQGGGKGKTRAGSLMHRSLIEAGAGLGRPILLAPAWIAIFQMN